VSGLPLLFATLIGVFITPDGIVVGSDTAVSSRSGQSTRQKYCVTGPRAVATLQGVYELTDTETKATVGLYDAFRDFCARIDRTQLPATLRGQAEFIAEAMREALDKFLRDVPTEEIIHKYGSITSDRVVARIAVSGYDADGSPTSAVVGLGIATNVPTNQWEARVEYLLRLSFRQCGVRFHGQEVVVQALRNPRDLRVPNAERRKPEFEKLSGLIGGVCSDASIKSAPGMFTEAARLTITYGRGFGIQPGIVNLPLDVVVIPKTGTIDISRIDSW
jgi:hypothetical protein